MCGIILCEDISAVTTLISSDVAIKKLWVAFIHHNLSSIDTTILYVLGFFICLLLLGNFIIFTYISQSLYFHSFFRLYAVCRYVDLDQFRQFRIPQVLFRHPESFDYGFAGSKLVIVVRKRDKGQDVVGTERVVESIAVIQPIERIPLLESPSIERVEETLPNVDMAIPQIARKSQEQILPLNNTSQIQIERDVLPKQEVSQENVQEQCHPIISLGRTVSLILEGEQTQKRVKIPLGKPLLAVLVYFALQRRGEWIDKQTILNELYRDERQKSSFNQHISRIRKQIMETASKEFIPTIFTEKSSDSRPFDPFEQEYEGKDTSRWRLSSSCSITGLNTLTKFYRKIKFNELLMKEDWRRRVHQLREIYSGNYLEQYADEETYAGGYLSAYLGEEVFKRWATKIFRKYREQYIFVLEYIAEKERNIAPLKANDTSMKRAAELYKECAYAATCDPLDQKLGEHALRKCIEMYMVVDDEDAAQHVCDIYAKRVKKFMFVWEPERETEECLDQYALTQE